MQGGRRSANQLRLGKQFYVAFQANLQTKAKRSVNRHSKQQLRDPPVFILRQRTVIKVQVFVANVTSVLGNAFKSSGITCNNGHTSTPVSYSSQWASPVISQQGWPFTGSLNKNKLSDTAFTARTLLFSGGFAGSTTTLLNILTYKQRKKLVSPTKTELRKKYLVTVP